jgi:hypothetical protein
VQAWNRDLECHPYAVVAQFDPVDELDHACLGISFVFQSAAKTGGRFDEVDSIVALASGDWTSDLSSTSSIPARSLRMCCAATVTARSISGAARRQPFLSSLEDRLRDT